MKKVRLICGLLGFIAFSTAYAGQTGEEVAREKARAAVMAAEQDNNVKPLTLEEPARRFYDWGAVLDKSFTVVAVTPGSDAATMGIKKGDKVLSVNGKLTERQPLKEVLAQFSELAEGDVLTVKVERAGKKQSFATKVHVQIMPAWKLEIKGKQSQEQALTKGRCGRVSVFFTPPQTRDLYPAYVNSIDGEGVLRSKDTFRLSPGDHQIMLHELITDYRLRRGPGMELAKPITIHVEPDTIYYLAAKFLPAKRFKLFKEEYWEPVVWQVQHRECK